MPGIISNNPPGFFGVPVTPPGAPVVVEGLPANGQVPTFNTSKGIYDPGTGGAPAGSQSIIEYQLQNYITWDPPHADPGGGFKVPDSAMSAANAISILDGAAHTFDGATLCKVEFTTTIENLGNGQQSIILFFDGSTNMGRLLDFYSGAAAVGSSFATPAHGEFIFIPSAGSHTFHLKAYKDVAGASSSIIYGGAGGVDGTVPAVYIVSTFSVAP